MLKLMTLNLWGYKHWDKRQEAILSLIKKLSPDIIALQEVQFDITKSVVSQASYLAEIGHYPYVIYTPSFRKDRYPREQSLIGGRSHGLAFMSKFPFTSNELYLLSQGEGFEEPCSVLFASVGVDGHKIELCNVHFGNTNQESNEHLEELSKLFTIRNIHPIILGDFNIFKLRDRSDSNLLKSYLLSSDELVYTSIPKNKGTLDYIAIPKEYSFENIICPDDVVSDHRAVFAKVKTTVKS